MNVFYLINLIFYFPLHISHIFLRNKKKQPKTRAKKKQKKKTTPIIGLKCEVLKKFSRNVLARVTALLLVDMLPCACLAKTHVANFFGLNCFFLLQDLVY